MKTRALICFLPACAAGLLTGWLVSRWIPRSSEAEFPRALSPATAPAKSPDEIWRASLAARIASFNTDGDGEALAHLQSVGREFAHSPMRAEFLKEDYLFSLSAQAIADLLEKGADLTESQRIAAFTRLSELDPALAFGAALRSGRERRLDFLQNIVCKAWLRTDATAADRPAHAVRPDRRSLLARRRGGADRRRRAVWSLGGVRGAPRP